MENQAGLSGQCPGSFRHGDGDCQAEDALGAADGVRLPEADEHLLGALAHVEEGSGRFSFGILTDTISVTEQLDFGYRLTSLACRIRARVEQTSSEYRCSTTDGDVP